MLSFSQFLDEATWARINRVRGGQIQRRKIISQRPGYRMQDGKLVRMSSMEKRKRHIAQMKAARKRKPMMARILKKKKTLTTKKTICGD
jgi:hypothetical protein